MRNSNTVAQLGSPLMQSGNLHLANRQLVLLLNGDFRTALTSPSRSFDSPAHALLGEGFACAAGVNERVVDFGTYETRGVISTDQFDFVQ